MTDSEVFRMMLQAAEDLDTRFLACPYGMKESAIDVTERVKEALRVAGNVDGDLIRREDALDFTAEITAPEELHEMIQKCFLTYADYIRQIPAVQKGE